MHKSHQNYLSIILLVLFLAISISLQYKVRVGKDADRAILAMGSAAPIFHCDTPQAINGEGFFI